MITRLGNKAKYAALIANHFPQHTVFIEFFCGGLGMYLNKNPRAKYNIMNDFDNDVYSFYLAIKLHKDKVLEGFLETPIHVNIYNYWKQNPETELVDRAIRFLYLNMFGFKGVASTLKIGTKNVKSVVENKIHDFFKQIQDVQFVNVDYKDVLKSAGQDITPQNTFIYCDPPYYKTAHRGYNTPKFTHSDTEVLFKYMVETGFQFAISEYEGEHVDSLIEKYGLYKTIILDRKSIAGKQTYREILITNYPTNQGLF